MSGIYTLPTVKEQAIDTLRRSEDNTLIGRIVRYSRRGATKVHNVMITKGECYVNGQKCQLNADEIVSVNWTVAVNQA